MILKVAKLGNPVLRHKAKPVPKKVIMSLKFQEFLNDLVDTMREYNGVGIAAPQVHVSLQVVVIEVEHNPRYPKAGKVPLTVLINPRLRATSKKKVTDWEGCLSIPKLRGQAPRSQSVVVEALDRKGKALRIKVSGFLARVLQHEWDHLQGRVYVDRMGKDLTTLTHLDEYTRYWT